MLAHDTVKNIDLEVDRDMLIQLMRDGRQVDFILAGPTTDCDGYLTWDVEHWSNLKEDKFIRTYELEGRTLRDYTHFNIYDMAPEFQLSRVKELRIS